MKAIKSAKIQRAGSIVCNSFCEHTAALLILPHGLLRTVSCLVMTRERRCQMLNHSLIPTTAMCTSVMPREKNIMKCYAGKRLHAEAKPIDVGDTVLVKQPQLNKLSTPFNPTPLVVTERKGTMVTALRGDGFNVTRNFYMSRSIRRR